MSSDRICIGVVTGAHGLRGQVRVKSFTDQPADIGAYGPLGSEDGSREFKLTVTGTNPKGQVLARLSDVTDRTAAEALKGLKLFIDRAALPKPAKDEFYYSDLVGLAVELVDGTDFGTVHAVHDFGAGEMIEVTGKDRKPVLVPFTAAAVPSVDVANRRLVIDPPVGLLEPGDPEKGERADIDDSAEPEGGTP